MLESSDSLLQLLRLHTRRHYFLNGLLLTMLNSKSSFQKLEVQLNIAALQCCTHDRM